MPKRGRISSSLSGLRRLAEGLAALKRGRVDVGFFAGNASRRGPDAKHTARFDKYVGKGSKEGYYQQGVEFANRRKALGGDGAAFQRLPAAQALTNPELAAKHEFGVGVPRRSMLRMPMHLHGDKVVARAKDRVKTRIKDIAKAPKATAVKMLREVGFEAENLVQEAFATRGFGTWKANSPVTIALKGSDSPLIDTAQLRRAVDSRVVA